MTPIKNIIFDFGDVFINLDKSATKKHLKHHNIQSLDDKTLSKNNDYERGLLTTEEFISYYTNKYQQLSEEDFVKAWNSMLLDLPDYRLDFLKKIKASQKYKMFLLSNTNDLHINWVKDNIKIFDEFKSCFDAFYLSHEINLRKPDVDIFEFVLNQNELNVQDTLFIDDTKEHIETAEHLNLNTWHLEAGNDDVIHLFEQKHLTF